MISLKEAVDNYGIEKLASDWGVGNYAIERIVNTPFLTDIPVLEQLCQIVGSFEMKNDRTEISFVKGV
jgi:hypothetical protein